MTNHDEHRLRKRYVDLEPVGQGGMGTLYRARDCKTGAVVAIKVIRADKADTAAAVRRFQREVRALQRLRHPNIVEFLDFHERQNVLYFTMEFLAGPSLQDVVARGPTEAATARGWFVALADAMAGAHAQGILHRDIKPSNIVFTADGVPKLVDFGLAKHTAVADPSSLTGTGQIVGTLLFLPPEVVVGGVHDERGDVYQLAFSLYLALTAQYPLTLATLAAHIAGLYELPPPSSSNTGVSPELDDLILAALAPKPDDRPPTAAEFRSALVGGSRRHGSPLRRSSRKATGTESDGRDFSPGRLHDGRAATTLPGGGPRVFVAAAALLTTVLWALPLWRHFGTTPPRAVEEQAPTVPAATVAPPHTPSPPAATASLPPHPATTAAGPTPDDWFHRGQAAYLADDLPGAVTAYAEAAAAGHVGALYALGSCTANGQGMPADPEAAVRWYMTAALQGHAEAQMALARCYRDGRGVPISTEQALAWFQRAGATGRSDGLAAAARCLDELGRGDEALVWYQRAAAAGDPAALDIVEARTRHLQSPSDQVDPTPLDGVASPTTTTATVTTATSDLGDAVVEPAAPTTPSELLSLAERLAWDGRDVEALAAYREAARSFDSDALVALGRALETGLGAAPDVREARRTYEYAAQRGHAPAQLALAEMLLAGRGASWGDELNVERWLYAAAKQNYTPAMVRLGQTLETGYGPIVRDTLAAYDWYRKAAQAGDRTAAGHLARCYRRGIGISKDETEARRWEAMTAATDDGE